MPFILTLGGFLICLLLITREIIRGTDTGYQNNNYED